MFLIEVAKNFFFLEATSLGSITYSLLSLMFCGLSVFVCLLVCLLDTAVSPAKPLSQSGYQVLPAVDILNVICKLAAPFSGFILRGLNHFSRQLVCAVPPTVVRGESVA